MDFKQINENLINMVEKTIDPDFRKMIKDTGDYQRDILRQRADYTNKQLDYYKKKAEQNPNDSFYRGEVDDYEKSLDKLNKAANAKNMDANRIYREVARFIDVQNSEMIKIPTEGLTSKDLRKKLKALGKPGVVVIPWDITNQYHITQTTNTKGSFKNMNVFFFEDKEGKLDIWAPYSSGYDDSPVIGNDKVQPMMKDLNDGSIARRTPFIYVFFGEKTLDVRHAKNRKARAYWDQDPNERVKIDPQDVKPAENPLQNTWSGGRYDKSGYFVDYNAIQKRLQKFKQQKGSYDKDVTEVIDKFSRVIDKYKKLVSEHDFMKDETPLLKAYREVIQKNKDYFNYLMKAAEAKDGPDIARWLPYCKKAVARLDV